MDTAQLCPVCAKPLVAGAPQGLCPECLIQSGFDTRGANDPADGKSAFIPPSVENLAGLFPQLEIIELLGRGGMGAVYKARQPSLGRFVALKILPPKRAGDPDFAERFNREARALARLNRPNIVAVYDFGQAGDMPYFLMEYVEGTTLRQVVQAGTLTPSDTLRIVMQICEALQFAHDEGVVHRDIKPKNILLDTKGRVKIADFGIAKVLDLEQQDLSLTRDKDVMGTANYMAPEQLENPQTVDHRADIFSLGVVFYELLTGELPLGKFQSPSQKAQVDARLDEVVMHTLEKEPARRYQQAREVRTDVETIADTPPPTEGVPPILQPAPAIPTGALRPRGRSTGWKIGVVLGVLGLAAVLLILVGAALFLGSKRTAKIITPASPVVQSNSFLALLNDDQRLVARYTAHKFHRYDDAREFEGWTEDQRTSLERRSLDIIKGPRSEELYQAINTLAALRSTNALPLLRQTAFDHRDTIVRLESSNRSRWMAIRALGIMGDQTAVPILIHLVYHNNSYVRWWAQISLVRLTGQNFGSDWKAWGEWWNSHSGHPPFDSEVVKWWTRQPEPDLLAKDLAEGDEKFLQSIKHAKLDYDSPSSTNSAVDL